MGQEKDSAADHQARQDKAAGKVAEQERVVARMNGTANDHPEEQQLLHEMRHNKVALDINRAMRDYDDEVSQ